MSFKSIRSIALKIVLSVATIVFVSVAIMSFIQVRRNEQMFVSDLEDETANLTATIRAALHNSMLKQDTDGTDHVLQKTGEIKVIKQVYVANLAGKITKSSGPLAGQSMDASLLARVKATQGGLYELSKTQDGSPYVQGLCPVPAEKACMACHSDQKEGDAIGYVGVDSWATEGFAQLKSARNFFLLICSATILLVVAAIAFVARSITRPLADLTGAARAMATGDFHHPIEYQSMDEVGVLADSFRELKSYAQEAANAADALRNGDLTVQITPKSANDVLSRSIQQVIDNQQKLIMETSKLSRAAVEGNLMARGEADQFHGSYRELVTGINDTLDAVIGPLRVAANYVDRISKGDIPAKIEDDYHGEFNEIKGNLNTCIDAINSLIADANMLSNAAVEGRLGTRADAIKHGGDFRRIVDGVNRTMDSLVGYLNSMPSPAFLVDLEYRIRYINEAAASVTSLAPIALIGTKCYDHFKTAHCRNEKCATGQCIALGRPVSAETDAHPGGLNLDIAYTAVPVKDADHRTIGAMEFCVDLTAQKTAARLAQKQAHFQAQEVEKLVVNLGKVARGDLKIYTAVAETDEDTRKVGENFLKINYGLDETVEAVRRLVEDTRTLARDAVAGKLDTRADATKHGGDFHTIIQGINETLDAVIGPLRVAADCVDRISKGDIPAKITDTYQGDFNEIKDNLNLCIDAVNALVADAGSLAQAAVAGKLNTRADAARHGGDFRRIVQGVNDTLDAVIGPLNVAASYVDRISKGDIPPKIVDNYNGDFNLIKNNLNTCIEAVNALVADANLLSKAAVEGKLATRADATQHQGDFRKIVQGVDDCLDAVIGPLNVAAKYVDRISKGDIPPKILDNYNGDFNLIKNNLNTCIDAVNALAADANLLSKAAVEGKLATRADAIRHQGDFRKIVQGVDDCLDAVIGPLNVAAKYVDLISKGQLPPKINDSYNGDFNVIKNNLNTCIDAINALVTDANLLSKAAVDGKLATRADASRHQGDFRKIVQGVDDCLDAVIGPLNVAAGYVALISKGDIPPKITDSYNGDFNEIKNNLNTCIDAVNALVADANLLAKAAMDGKLDTRADAAKHGGDFRKIVQGVNNTLDAVISPVNEASEVLEKVAAKDLTARVHGDYKGDLAKLKDALNTAVQNLDDALLQVSYGAHLAASASEQISAGSQSLAQGASEQASSLEEVSSSLQEMSSMTKQNMANAKEARGLADAARKSAEKGMDNMQQLSHAIDRIKASSDATAKIVKTIDEIAFQTNLLALNAAVEAARAGDAGRGFAVVADEVRNLAMRSAEAAKNTANLIEESVRNAKGGVKINHQVLNDLKEINGQVNIVSKVTTEIAAASEQQAQRVDQVNAAVEQMNQVTQQTAANAEESASAAEELSGQSEDMKNMVKTFNLTISEDADSGSSRRRSGAVPSRTAMPAAPRKRGSISKMGTEDVDAAAVLSGF